MSSLSDLFVSYKQVESPKYERSLELPTNRFQQLLEYVNNRKTPQEPETQEPETQTDDASNGGFVGWTFSASPVTDTSKVSTSWSNPYSSNKSQWVKDMTNAYKKYGLSDNAIKNLIAKNALESGWGRSAQGDYNFGNITTGNNWKGRFISGKDKDANGQKISQKFRAYDSLDDYVKDEIQFLTKLYDFNQDDNFTTFINKLQGNNSGGRRYAADKHYANKVRSVYNSIKS